MDYSHFTSLSEIMEIEKVIDVIHGDTGKNYRLEVIRHCVGTASVHYMVEYYERDNAGVWVRNTLRWVNQGSADAALHEALAYIDDNPQGDEWEGNDG